MDTILEVEDLHVAFQTYGGTVKAVRGVNLTIRQGETVAIVGESGCGKSVTAQSIMQLIPTPPGRITKGSIRFRGQELLSMGEEEMRRIRGAEIAMIFQDPMTSLNPTITIGEQLTEGLRKHRQVSRKKARTLALEMLQLVGIPAPETRLKQYPHQFSGGMRQRIMIAMALICEPAIIIADEPTTALDVTIQAQILELFQELQAKIGVALLLITHDLGVVAGIADRTLVMYAGQVVEEGKTEELFYRAQHPYTRGLLHSVPRLDWTEKVLQPIPGVPPDLFAPPPGCAFVARCPYAMEACVHLAPPRTRVRPTHYVACWLQDPRGQQLFPHFAAGIREQQEARSGHPLQRVAETKVKMTFGKHE